MPDVPEPIVPSQYASTCLRSKPWTEATAPPTASISRSSIERPQCSPNLVQPMPTIATRSWMPLLAIRVFPPTVERRIEELLQGALGQPRERFQLERVEVPDPPRAEVFEAQSWAVGL